MLFRTGFQSEGLSERSIADSKLVGIDTLPDLQDSARDIIGRDMSEMVFDEQADMPAQLVMRIHCAMLLSDLYDEDSRTFESTHSPLLRP